MSNLRVLIVGASIAGPTAAYWFAKAGASVTVIERFPALRTNGQNVDIRTAGVTVMRKMAGMEAAVRAKTTQMEGLSFVHADGRAFATLAATGNPDQQSLISEYEIFRGDLAKILFDLTADNPRIHYVFGEQVASMHPSAASTSSSNNNDINNDGPLTVQFANGHPAAEYDLVVACDGATSRTRALGLGCGVRDHVQPLNSWTAFLSLSTDLLHGSKMGQAYSAPGGRWVAVGPDPMGGSRVGMMGIHPRGDRDATLPFRTAAAQGDKALKTFVAERFRGMGWKVDAIVDELQRGVKDFYAAEMLQVKVPTLFRGRFVLVGDAGYAPGPMGTGTSLAMAGAYVLAGEVASHAGDVAAGLHAYETRMRPMIADMQKIPPGIPGLFAPQTAWGITLRNCLFRLVAFGMSFGKWFAWLGGFFASSFGGDKYNLPDYKWVT